MDAPRQTLLTGTKTATRKPTHLSKASEVMQGSQEFPAGFLGCPRNAFREYTPTNPDAPENQQAIDITFVTELAPDIHRKL